MMGEWQSAEFAQICEHSAFGPRFAGELYTTDGNVATLRTTDISADGRIEYDTMPLARLDLERFQQHVLRTDDLVITRSGRVGTTALFNGFHLPVLPGAFLIRFRLKRDIAEPRFYRYFFNSPVGQELLTSVATGSVQQNINITSVHGLRIPVPPIEEQRAIAHILGTLDDKIELNRRMNETLEAMARALFKSWFVDFDPVRAKAEGRDPGLPKPIADLFPDRFEDSELGEIPAGWKVKTLPEVIEVNPTRSLRKGEVAPYLDMANMPTRGHSPDEVIERPFGSGMRFINGDTLVARITPCLENGKTAFVDFLVEGQVGWGSTEYIVLRPKLPFPEEFAYCLARSMEFREFAIQSMTGSSGRQRVPAESLSHFRVVAAPKPITELFGCLIKSLFARASAASKESRLLAALRDTLLPKLISGELRVKDIESIAEATRE